VVDLTLAGSQVLKALKISTSSASASSKSLMFSGLMPNARITLALDTKQVTIKDRQTIKHLQKKNLLLLSRHSFSEKKQIANHSSSNQVQKSD